MEAWQGQRVTSDRRYRYWGQNKNFRLAERHNMNLRVTKYEQFEEIQEVEDKGYTANSCR